MREFRIEGKKKTLVWRIWRDGADVHVAYGTLGGQLQHTSDRIKGVKAGTSAYLNPEANAIEEVIRKIRDKTDAGYVEVDAETGKPLSQGASKIDFRDLQKNLCWMKPRPQPKEGTKDNEVFQSVIRGGNYVATFKRDGFMHPVLIDDKGKVKIYTRRMESCTAKYPHLVSAFENMLLPTRSILLCEFVVVKDDHDNRLMMQAISNSLPDRARGMQTVDKARAVVLSIPFWNGVDIFSSATFGASLEFLEEQFGEPLHRPEYVDVMEIDYHGFEHAKKEVKHRRLEGLVVYDLNAVPGERAYNFRGKPERPECWKWKPVLEDDFLVVFDPDLKHWGEYKEGGSWGRGKHQQSAGRVALYQYDVDGTPVFISGCGSGFTDEQRAGIVKVAGTHKGIVGVAEVKFVERRYVSHGDKTNSLVEPVFVRWRTDKSVEEIVNPELKA